jgi:hypothetical protein
MSRRIALVVGGLAAIGTAIGAVFASKKTTDAVKDAVAGVDKDGAPLPVGAGTTVPVRVTGYWPFTARPDEVKMEGGVKDRKGNPLHTLEDFQAGKAQFVSVSGDYTIWPYGQRISLAEWPGVVFRVVDTGSHFHGANKVYRIAGREPLDVCVQSSETKVIAPTDATIYPGDHFEKKSKDVAVARIGKPTVAVGDSFAEHAPLEFYLGLTDDGEDCGLDLLGVEVA